MRDPLPPICADARECPAQGSEIPRLDPMMVRQLSIAFADRESFEREYQQNLSNGGIFIPTQEHFDPREVVEVAIELPFCERSEALQAEVVTQIDPDIGVAGARPGVALQFVLPAEKLRLCIRWSG